MATVHHHHVPGELQTTDRSGGLGFFLGILMLIVFLFLMLYYGLPALRGATQGPQINVPGQIDVNVKQ
jgi:hypothetical protein